MHRIKASSTRWRAIMTGYMPDKTHLRRVYKKSSYTRPSVVIEGTSRRTSHVKLSWFSWIRLPQINNKTFYASVLSFKQIFTGKVDRGYIYRTKNISNSGDDEIMKNNCQSQRNFFVRLAKSNNREFFERILCNWKRKCTISRIFYIN